ncbi:MAG: SCP2 sterol-binding domain-containing protein [Firmicutes bacterium]|nr:SCP2 sterol-binding domain-containing protein [Bacillota bacterium]
MSQIDARAVMSGMKDNFARDRAKDVSATVTYELSGEGGGVWTLTVDQGSLSVDEGEPSGSADATVRMSAADFVQVALGNLSAMTGFMTGRIKIEGNPLVAQKVQGLFNKPEGI